jgi:mannose-1-phosphate guanylyltransferase
VGEVVGMILCAGLGTRLRPLTDVVPKPAVPVCGVPLVRWALALLAGAGARRAVVNVHHLPGAMARAAEEAARAAGVALAVSEEPVIAGTGGALREARRLLGGAEAIVVVNGDVLFDVDLSAAVAAHRESGALATMVLLPMPAGARYATVDVDGSGAIRRIAGAFGPGGEGLVPWHFSGVHVIAPELLDRVPAEPFECDVNRHVYPPLMASGAVRGHVVQGYWNDLGTPARYLEASGDVLRGRVPLARFRGVDPLGGTRELAPGIRAAESAKIDARALLVAPAYVGAACVVPAGATVSDAILWEGTPLAPGEVVEHAIAAGALRVPARSS